MHKKTWLLVVLIAFVLGLVAGGIFGAAQHYPLKARMNGQTLIRGSWARGDEADPGPVDRECVAWMHVTEQEHKVVCELLDARVGSTERECPEGLSPTGCARCTIACK